MEVDTSFDDSQQTLSQIAQKHGRSIVDMLVHIQESVVLQSKSMSFLERLECLQPIEYPFDNPPRDSQTGEVIPRRSTDDPAIEYKFMRRCHVHVLDLPARSLNYVALSYTWLPKDGDDKASGRYWIENKQQTGFDISPVRNTVLDRITNFMSAHNFQTLWIDQHCIIQTTTCTSGNCSHEDCNEKRDAVHAMDLVYSASRVPTALLSHYIRYKDDILLLDDLLNPDSNLMEPDPPSTDGGPDYRIPTRALLSIQLVFDIISDPWWSRAWTFQENMLATSTMQLLLRHAPELEDFKTTTEFGRIGTIPGELRISSRAFSIRTTWLCMAVLQKLLKLTEGRLEMLTDTEMHWVRIIFEIKKAIAGTKARTRSMDSMCVVASFPGIVEKKEIAKYWDRLAIVGNCCRFSSRLEPLELQRQGHSISISTLALFLLNGEVLDNGKERTVPDVSSMKASQYLETQLLDNRKDTLSVTGDCRLPDVALTNQGVRARGHLWQLGEEIRLSKVEDTPESMRCVRKSGNEERDRRMEAMDELFDNQDQDQFRKLIMTIEGLGYTALAADLKAFFEHPTSRSLFFPDQLAQWDGSPILSVAGAVFAIGDGWPIRLGRISDPSVPEDKSLYRALFVFPPGNFEDIQFSTPPVVFTSTLKRNPSPLRDDKNAWEGGFNLIKRRSYQYAALQVEVEDSSIQSSTPQGRLEPVIALRTQGWANGLCFTEDIPPREVVFPWPDELLNVVPNQDGQDVGQS